ncbi:MAG: hypothetical protein GIKADHBN_01753 [Phycisphaerales bacterium]|nr:hypothetical protein [Phycisphaerales bacterium]
MTAKVVQQRLRVCGFRVTRVVAVLGLLVALLRSWLAPVEPRTLWSPVSGTPPEGFTYLAFPKSDAVPLFDGPDQDVVGVLDRALANELPESIEVPWIRVNVADRSLWVRGSDLVLDPAGLQVEQLLKGYAARLVGVSGDAFAYASFKQYVRSGQTVHVLTLHFDDSIESYEYAMQGTRVIPLSMKRVDGKAAAFHGAITLFGWLCAVAAVCFVVVVVEQVWMRRNRVQHMQQAA